MARKTIAQLEEQLKQRDDDIAAHKSQLLKAGEMCEKMNDKIRSLENDLQEALRTIIRLEIGERVALAAVDSLNESIDELLKGNMTFRMTVKTVSDTE